MSFTPNFTITNRMTQAITRIERARGFLEAVQLSADWVRQVTKVPSATASSTMASERKRTSLCLTQGSAGKAQTWISIVICPCPRADRKTETKSTSRPALVLRAVGYYF